MATRLLHPASTVPLTLVSAKEGAADTISLPAAPHSPATSCPKLSGLVVAYEERQVHLAPAGHWRGSLSHIGATVEGSRSTRVGPCRRAVSDGDDDVVFSRSSPLPGVHPRLPGGQHER